MKYSTQSTITLNNIGASLLARGNHQAAVETFQHALNVISNSQTTQVPEMQQYRNKAALALAMTKPPPFADPSLQIKTHTPEEFALQAFCQEKTKHDACTTRIHVVCLSDDASHADMTENVTLVTTILQHNLGMAYLCLASVSARKHHEYTTQASETLRSALAVCSARSNRTTSFFTSLSFNILRTLRKSSSNNVGLGTQLQSNVVSFGFAHRGGSVAGSRPSC